MIENSSPSPQCMDGIEFPHFTWRSSDAIEGSSLTRSFLKHRPDEHWVLVGEGVAQCHAQLWTAWHSAARRQRRSTSLARSFDAEFLRYLAGTHHVSDAFKRAGMRDGDEAGCFLVLPDWKHEGNHLPTPDESKRTEMAGNASKLADAIGVDLVDEPLVISHEGAQRLGFNPDPSSEVTCDALIGHVISAEFNS